MFPNPFKIAAKSSKMLPKWSPNPPKIEPKSFKIALWDPLGNYLPKRLPEEPSRTRPGPPKVRHNAPKSFPKSLQNRSQMTSKIEAKFDSILDAIFVANVTQHVRFGFYF